MLWCKIFNIAAMQLLKLVSIIYIMLTVKYYLHEFLSSRASDCLAQVNVSKHGKGTRLTASIHSSTNQSGTSPMTWLVISATVCSMSYAVNWHTAEGQNPALCTYQDPFWESCPKSLCYIDLQKIEPPDEMASLKKS